jgi:hypothetical protein
MPKAASCRAIGVIRVPRRSGWVIAGAQHPVFRVNQAKCAEAT